MFQYLASRSPQALLGFARVFALRLLCLGLLCLGLFAPLAPTGLHAEPNAASASAAPALSSGDAPSVEKASSADAVHAPETPTETRELWTGKLYSSTYRAGVCLGSDGKVRGVLLLRVPSGKVDVYHFHGQHGDGRIRATHSSGHNFEGQLDSEEVVSGTIRLKSGFTVDLKGQRTHGVELTETCRPLPE